ncbi:caspase family protein [Streptomyces griseoviridis]|uniref:caspase family protein n=1 Tax=Streptomyces griseoviridis TaxID=45398 RepID=UPI0034512452
MTDTAVPRWALVAGNREYEHLEQLPYVDLDLDIMAGLLSRLGYGTARRISGCTTEGLRTELADWATAESDDDRGEGTLVLYYTGHGDRSADDRHYLLCRDSRPGRLKGTALATEDVVGIVTETGLRRLLLIIDTCYAGQGSVDAVRELARSLTATREADQHRFASFSVIAAARPLELAADGAFAEALRDAVDDPTLGGPRQRKLFVEQVVDRVNELLAERSPGQHATFGTLCGDEVPLFPNPRYAPDVPAEGVDLSEQRVALSTEGRRRREELVSHFGPRGRGTDRAAERGTYFTGRHEALRALTAWVDGKEDAHDHIMHRMVTADIRPRPTVFSAQRQLVVTGSPGVGKSALLGRLVVENSEVTRRPDLTELSELTGLADPRDLDWLLGVFHEKGRIHAAIHARHKLLSEVVAAVADAAGLPGGTGREDLLHALAERSEPLVLVIDALDEADTASGDGRGGEAERIASALLAPLAEIPCVRLLVGTRPRVVGALGRRFTTLDLDDPQWGSSQDVADYAHKLLRAPDGLGSTGAYEGVADSRQVAEAIAAHAEGNNYLVARLIARALAHRPEPLDTKTPGWRQQIPHPTDSPSLTAGPAFRWALRDQLHEDADRARSLLLPLALAQGAGLPSATVWPAVASELTGVPVTADDIRWVMRAAGAHIVEELDADGRSVYRLYHESFADELRADAAPGALTAVTRALLSLVPTDAPAGLRDWSGADPYVLAHLATHAAGCGLLDDLVCDPGFLVHADPTALQRGLPVVRSTPARAARAVYEQVGPELSREPDPRARLAQLRLSALQSGDHELAEAVGPRGGERLPWDTEWTVPLDDRAAGYRAIGSYEGEVTAVTLLEFDGRKVVVTAETPNRVRLWDFVTGTSLGELPGAADHPVRALAPLPGAESSRLLVLSGAQEGFGSRAVLGLFDLRTLAPAGPSVPTRAFAWAVTDVEGRPVVALLESGAILLVDPTDGRKLTRVPVPQVGHTPLWWHGSRGGWRIGMGMRAGQLVVVIAGSDVDSVGNGRIWEWAFDPGAGWQVTRSSPPRRVKGHLILSVAVWEDRTWVVSTLANPPLATDRQRQRIVRSNTLAEWTEYRRLSWAELVSAPGEKFLLCYGEPDDELGVVGLDGHLRAAATVSGSPAFFRHVRTDTQGHHVLSWQGDSPAPRVWTLRSPTGPPSRRKHRNRLRPTLSAGQYAGRQSFFVLDRFLDAATGDDVTPPRGHAASNHRTVGHPELPPLRYSWQDMFWGPTLVTFLGKDPLDLRLPNRLTPGLGRLQGQDVIVGPHSDWFRAWSLDGELIGQWSTHGNGVPVQYVEHEGNLLAAVPHAQGGGIQVYSFPDGAPGFSLLRSSVPRLSGHHLGLWCGEPVIGALLDGGISVFHALSGKPLWRYEDMSHRRAYPILRLLTVHGRRLALVVRPDQSLTFLDADADRVAFRIHPGARVDAIALAGEDLLGVLTTKDFTCLRLPAH